MYNYQLITAVAKLKKNLHLFNEEDKSSPYMNDNNLYKILNPILKIFKASQSNSNSKNECSKQANTAQHSRSLSKKTMKSIIRSQTALS